MTKVATWNLYFENSDARIKSGISRLISGGAQVIGFQELSSDTKQQMVDRYLTSLGWDTTRFNSAVTMGWNNKTHELVKQDSILVTKGGERWEAGTAGTRAIYKVIILIHIRDRKTGQESVHLNNHIIPGIEKNGKLRTDVPIRMKYYDMQMDALVKTMKEYTQPGRLVTASGDFNLAWEYSAGRDLEKRMKACKSDCNWEKLPDVNTHGSRVIDYIWAVNGNFVSQTIMGKSGSDHTGFVVNVSAVPLALPPVTVTQHPAATGIWEVTVDKDSYLWGVPLNPRAPKSDWKKRPDGYKITTGTAFLNKKDSKGQMRRYLVTKAKYLYATDYLTKIK